jgi:CopG family nickel-responsive transcriptional regulator
MITTINVSLGMLEQVDELISKEGYKSRSEVFRAGIKELVGNRSEKISGKTKCVILLSHHKEKETALNLVKHKYEDLVETQVHTHLEAGLCTELFVISGDGERISSLIREFRKKGAERILFIPSRTRSELQL